MKYYRARPVDVQAIQLNMDITYYKWGGDQTALAGDWLLSKDGDTYTCAKSVFKATYKPAGRMGFFYKDVVISAEIAKAAGKVKTLEGHSSYLAGDYIVTNPGGDRYPIVAAQFERLYELVK